MPNRVIFPIYHEISSFGRTGISYVASVSWSIALLMSVSLQQNVIDTAINEWRKQLRASVHADGQHFEHLLWAFYETEKSWTNKV